MLREDEGQSRADGDSGTLLSRSRARVADVLSHPVQQAMLEDDLWAYGFRVLKSALRTGRIVTMCHDAGVPLYFSDEQRRVLHTSVEERDTLTVDTLTRAVPYFLSKVLARGRWNPERASLQTYFVGCCVRAFPDVFRAWARDRQKRLSELDQSEAIFDEQSAMPSSVEPEFVATARDTIRVALRRARPEVRVICSLIAQGYTHAEIGEKLGGISARAVEGHMRRLRASTRWLTRKDTLDLSGSAAGRGDDVEVAR